MLGKTSKPVIEILTGSLVSASRDVVGTSPRGLKNFDFGGVGLGIVAALERSGGGRSDIPANKTLFGRNIMGSSPIPVSSTKNSWRKREEMEMESLEEYTIVTCHGPNKTYTTKVYPHAPPTESGRKGDDRTPFRIQSSSNRPSVFHISPARHGGGYDAPAPDFLSSCNLCHKKLHGKDIYMYRGEKAFCSTECRYRQMVADDRKEKCGAEVARSATEAAGSPYTNGGGVFTTGILAI